MREQLTRLDSAYDNARAFPGVRAMLTRWDEESSRTREQAADSTDVAALLDLRYGTGERCRLDLFLAPGAMRPLMVFFHGGYWHLSNKDRFTFVARFLLDIGFHAAIVGYPLAPLATMAEIVAATRTSIDWLASQSKSLCWPISRWGVMGWSAGAHLAALSVKHPVVQFGVGLSGIYNLEPIQRTYLNATLKLTGTDVETFSPLCHIGEHDPPFSVAVGADELIGLRLQSLQFHRLRKRRRTRTAFWRVPGKTHFEVLDALVGGDSAMEEFLVSAARAH
jgi:arylformamidase